MKSYIIARFSVDTVVSVIRHLSISPDVQDILIKSAIKLLNEVSNKDLLYFSGKQRNTIISGFIYHLSKIHSITLSQPSICRAIAKLDDPDIDNIVVVRSLKTGYDIWKKILPEDKAMFILFGKAGLTTEHMNNMKGLSRTPNLCPPIKSYKRRERTNRTS